MPKQLVPSTLLFNFLVDCHYLKELWSEDKIELPASYKIPCFAELESRPMFADLRLGWNESGITVSLRVEGKTQLPWCRASRVEDSDGLSLCLDTRDVHDVHRASRFCHRFVFLPRGGGRASDQPMARLIDIHRARDNPKSVRDESLKIRAEKLANGYRLRGMIPAEAITGFDPDEHIRLGFNYAVTDSELGWQTFAVGSEFPTLEDPSLWATLELDRVQK